jgi:glycosyltransferase involved in cell wall biosynthesis
VKVAFDASDAVAPDPRGWGRYAACLLEALRERRDASLEPLVRTGRGPEAWWEQVSLPRELRRVGADLVHAPNCFLPLRRPCPGVVTIHDLAFEAHPDDFSRRTGWKYRFVTPRAARSAERVICPSAFTRDDLAARYGIDPGKVRVIPEAPALPMAEEEPPPGPYLLAVGDLRRKKNLARLVRAFARLHADGIPHRLVLAGFDAGEGERLQAEAGPAPLELTGYVPDARLDALLRGAELVVYPSVYEGFGLVLLEAMARRTPVACADATALPATAGDAAVLFDPLDEEAMAAAIRRPLEDAALRERLVERGRERVAGMSWARVAEQTAAVYREAVLASRR